MTLIGVTLAAGADARRDGRSAAQRPWAGPAATASAEGRAQALRAYGRLPLAFVENRGQTDARVRYYAQGSRYELRPHARGGRALARRRRRGAGITLACASSGPTRTWPLQAQERAAGRRSTTSAATTRRAGRRGWRATRRFVYRELWPGVDLQLRGQAGTLKYEFRVRPGARVATSGWPTTGRPDWRWTAPARCGSGRRSGVAARRRARSPTRRSAARRVPVASRFVLGERRGEQYGFAVGAGYDPDRELIIDPGLEYSTFLGGASNEVGTGIEVDAAGNAYVTGFTQSPNFPTTSGAFDRTGSASNSLDAFVSKLNPTGTALVYSTFLGGTNFEMGRALAVDAAGNAYVAGQTRSSNFPTTSGAFDRTLQRRQLPALRHRPAGRVRHEAERRRLGPRLLDVPRRHAVRRRASHIALDGARQRLRRRARPDRRTSRRPPAPSTRPPTAAATRFVTKLNAAGSALVYSTRLGGADNDPPGGLAVDAAGNAYVGGSTRSADFPTTPGAFDTTHNGGTFETLFDAFVTKLNASRLGARLLDVPRGRRTWTSAAPWPSTRPAAPTWPARRRPRSSRRPPARSTPSSAATSARASSRS